MEVGALCAVILHSMWLLPVLAVMIAVDGPVPLLPSETILLTALAVALAERDVPMLVGLFLAAVVGQVAGDFTVFGLGRTSRRFVRVADSEGRFTGWVRRNVLCRPGTTMVGARFVPGGRLVSTAAAGRFGLPARLFLPCSMASSSAWAIYMTLEGMIINPIADGRPLSALLGGVAFGVLTAALFAAAKAVRDRRRVQPTTTSVRLMSPAGRTSRSG